MTKEGRLRHKSFSILLWGLFVLAMPRAGVSQSNFVFVNNGGSSSNSVSAFSAAPNGTLTSVPGSPFQTGAGSASFGNDITVSPTRNEIYVSNDRGSTISAFHIDPITGVLTLIQGSPFSSGTGIVGGLSLAITPDNQFLFAGNKSTGAIAAFSIAANDGLIPVPGLPVPAQNNHELKVSPDGEFLFAIVGFTPRVAVFLIDIGGGLTPVPGSPFPLTTECDPESIDINCAGSLLFVGSGCAEVSAFNVASTGVLSPVTGSPFNTGIGIYNILVNASGSLLVVTDIRFAKIIVFGIGPTGAVSSVPISSVNITNPSNEDTRPVDLALNREESLVYVNSADGTLFVFNITPGGILTPAPGSPFPGHWGYGSSIVAYPARACSPVFDTCIQDDSSNNILKINSTTGEYQLSDCNGGITAGRATLTRRGCLITLQDYSSDRRLLARLDTCQNKATAAVQLFSSGRTVTIIDGNTLNNTCSCR
jgi:6-phosphogluconolactonase